MFCEELSQKDSMTDTAPSYDIDSMKDVQYQILAKAYPGYAYAPWGEARRKTMCDHLRLGFSWWRLACSLGHGALFIASNDVARLLYVS